MNNALEFNVQNRDGSHVARTVNVKKLCLGIGTSRNVEAIRESLRKLSDEGYRIMEPAYICKKSRYLVTNEDVIEVQGPHTYGEVEYVVISDKGETLISVGCDHNDMPLCAMQTEGLGKVYDSPKEKQMVPAVIARDAWKYEEVRDHWDKLNVKNTVVANGMIIPYQDYMLEKLFGPEYHFSNHPWLKDDGVILFGGSSETLPSVPANVCNSMSVASSIRNLVFPSEFRFEIVDPIMNRRIFHSYQVLSLEEPY